MADTTILELLTELSRDPAARAEFEANPDAYLSAHGFDLEEGLLGEAIVNVAATLPPEIAEHLSAFTIAHSPIPAVDEHGSETDAPGEAAGLDALVGLGLLATVPVDVAATELGADDPDAGDTTNADGGEGILGFGHGAEPTVGDGWANGDEPPVVIDSELEPEPAPEPDPFDGGDGFDPVVAAPDGLDLEVDDPADLDELDGFDGFG